MKAGIPMRYAMPAEALRGDLRTRFPKGTTTLRLVQEGIRRATTRRPFAKVGETISFEGDPTLYVTTSTARPDLGTAEGRAKWEELEGWSLTYVEADKKLKAQVFNPASVQTIFKRKGGQNGS